MGLGAFSGAYNTVTALRHGMLGEIGGGIAHGARSLWNGAGNLVSGVGRAIGNGLGTAGTGIANGTRSLWNGARNMAAGPRTDFGLKRVCAPTTPSLAHVAVG